MNSRHTLSLAAFFAACLATGAGAMSVPQAVELFDLQVRNYNVITERNANLAFINNDTEGPVAVGGNLTVGGVPLVNFSQFNASADPTLYVKGTFTISNNGVVQLNNGYAALPGMAGLGTYPYQNNAKRYRPPGTNGWLQINSNTAFSSADPRTNPGPAGWDFSSKFAAFRDISASLASAAANGSISVANNKLLFTGAASGVSVFNLDANLLSGNKYAGQSFSSVTFSIPSDQVYVVNLLNADGKTVFGGSGVNFNLSDAMAGRLLWNVVGTEAVQSQVHLGNGGEFHGSVLAPFSHLTNALNAPINGQIVAQDLTYTNAQIHYAGFTVPAAAIPEPATCAALLGLSAMAAAVRRRRAGVARFFARAETVP